MPFEYIVPGDHETFFIRRFDLARSIPYSTYSTVAACRQSIQYGTGRKASLVTTFLSKKRLFLTKLL